ncbi:amino acid deaminase [Psychromonas aquimarina]|uniref:amino acid deaminase n=1 Tax=Psychromonas aquimarina TaxID=444919 RepID=UPI001FDFAB0D|nr:amino acid deaminase [Psychromonas aquimarina]
MTKGIASETAEQWNLLQEDLSLPLAVIYRSRIENNLKWMQAFADSYQVKLAPHGKTTMAPDLFLQQKEAGAWAVTLATVPQVAAAYQHGLKRIIMANQLVGKQNMRLVSELILTGDLEFYCLVDSVENVQQLARFFAQTGLTLNLLIEISVPGGRCGCRNEAQIDQLAAEIALHPCLKLTGIEVYEGVIHGENAEQLIREFLADVIQACNRLLTRKAFDSEQIILTGAGSAWYDVVSDTFANTKLDKAIIPVIRPGCYLIHDTGIYQDAQKSVLQRNQRACDLSGDLQSALEVWTYVQSIPEPGFAVIAMGKRDVAFDAGLPTAELHYRPGKTAAKPASEDWLVTQIMDQHAFLTFPDDDDIKVGDMIAFSTSHPCLTFDKWKNIAVVDDQYNVTDIFKTCF